MLEKILKLYTMAMANDVRSPMPHLFGPPGCGKSSVVQQAAEILGVKCHIINVSRISPLDLEGVQMPVQHTEDEMRLSLLTATFWTQLNDGDILMLEEFLRGFPEVYNGLLDIITSREVAGFKLPKVFIIGASNSTVAYDKALEDRMLHLPVPDLRRSKTAKDAQAKRMCEAIGLMPEMYDSYEMRTLLDTEVLPMYEIMDQIGGKSSAGATLKGSSLRNLIGQAQLREVHSHALKELIQMNNTRAMQAGKPQYVILLGGRHSDLPPKYMSDAESLIGNPKLTERQALNLKLNLLLIKTQEERQSNMEGSDEDDAVTDDIFDQFA